MSSSGLWRLVPLILALPLIIASPPAWGAATDPPPVSCPIGGYAAVSCPIVSDPLIAQVVRSRLGGTARLPYFVQVNVVGGIVYLSGYVKSRAQQDAAGILASTVKGARYVCNNILIRPPAASDFTILAAVNQALRHSTYNVHMVRVIVDNGVVTLTGMVEDEETKTIVVMIPAAVQGVTQVIDQLTVRERWSN
jgi:osmotically-inducible protein OsmY